MTLRALVTRPEADAAPVAEALRARGLEVTVEPLLIIRPLSDAALDLEGAQALLFTSANGVRAFIAHPEASELPAFAVGDTTAEAAREAGFEQVENAAGDVNDLARLVRERLDPGAGPLVHVAGSVTAGDLAGLLGEAGFELRRAVLYEADPVERFTPDTAAALADGAFDLVLFFSPRTAASFVELVRHSEDAERLATGCGKADALCLSPAVAEAADELPWRRVRTADRPDLPSMLTLVDVAVQAAAEPADAPASEPEPARPTEPRSEPTSQPVPEPPAGPWAGPAGPAPLPARQRSAVAAGLVGLAALVAALVAVAAVLTQPWWGPGLGLATAPQETASPAAAGSDRLAEAEQRLSAVAGRLDRIDDTLGGLGAQLTALGDRLAAIDEAGADAGAPGTAGAPKLPPEIEALPERFDKLEQQIGDLAAAMQQPPPPAPQTITALSDLRAQTDQLRTGLAAVREQLAAAPKLRAQIAAQEATAARRAETAAVMLAAGQLRAALASDRPFTDELTALRTLAGDKPGFAETIEPLAAQADSGIPTVPDLQAAFPETARAVARAGQAEKLGADPASQSWIDRTLAGLSSLVTVRPVGDAVEGEGPMARVARAEVQLEAGDLEAAVAELSNLTGAPAEAAAGWLDRARARIAADAAAAKLQATLVRALAQQSAAPSDTAVPLASPPETPPETPPGSSEPAPAAEGGSS